MSSNLTASASPMHKILHEKRPLTPELAARIAKLLDTSADSWLRMQAVLDLWVIQQDPKKLAGINPIKQTEYAVA